MRFMLSSLCLAIVFFASIGQMQAADIYVSAGKGNDANSGTKANPLASIQAAKGKVRQLPKNGKIRVMIDEGTYFLNEPLVFNAEDGGTEVAPIIYQSWGKIKPVIHGGKVLPRFERVSPQLWKVFIPEVSKNKWIFEQLFINGKRATRARSPQNGSFYKVNAVVEKVIFQGDNQAFAEKAEQTLAFKQTGEDWVKGISKDELNKVVVTIYHNWDITRKKISQLTDSSLNVLGAGMRPWNKFGSKSTFVVENSRSFLDEEGEWFLENSGTLYYIPRKGETIENTTAIAPVLGELLTVSGDNQNKVKNITFQNISFQYTTYQLPEEGYEPQQAAATTNAAINIRHAEQINFADCEVKHTGNYGLSFENDCQNSTVKSSYFYDLGAGGIKIGEPKTPEGENQVTRNIVIDNNIIMSGGHIFPTGVGVIIFHSSDNIITHNDISDFGYTGISVGWVWGYTPSYAKNNQIAYNHIHHLGWGILSDMGGVYLLGNAPGTVVEHNVIHHIYSYDYGGWGLYTDEGSTGVVLRNNLVYACKSSGFHQHYGKENFILNNIFASQVKAQLEATRLEDHLSFTFKHNIIYADQGQMDGINWTTVKFLADSNSYWDTRTKDIRFGKQSFTEWQAAGKDSHSIIADPQFKDAAKSDYRISNKTLMKSIGFKPFKLDQAGVYGSEKWKALPLTNRERENSFDEEIAKNELK